MTMKHEFSRKEMGIINRRANALARSLFPLYQAALMRELVGLKARREEIEEGDAEDLAPPIAPALARLEAGAARPEGR